MIKRREHCTFNQNLHFSLDEINERIKGLNVPPIMLPSQVFLVDEIPMLGVVKVDFKGAKNLAMNLVK